MLFYTCQEDKRKRQRHTFWKGSIGVSKKGVVNMIEYIFDVIYLIILYRIVKEIK